MSKDRDRDAAYIVMFFVIVFVLGTIAVVSGVGDVAKELMGK